MKVTDAVETRRSVRAFLDRPVDRELLRGVLERAARAPSGGNLQPWHVHVLQGERLAAFKALMAQRLEEAPQGEGTEYPIYPEELVPPYRERVFEIGEALYGSLGIVREDKPARRAWFARNYRFFDAPAALFCFVDRRCGSAQWSDLGMYLQTVMLLLREAGLDSCAQESWARFHRTVSGFVGAPEQQMLFCGMAIGYADPGHPANNWRSPRAAADAFLTFHD